MGDTTMTAHAAFDHIDTLTFPATPSRRQVVVGRVLSGLAIAFLTFDAAVKLARLPAAIESTIQLGYSASSVLGIGLAELAALILYAFPRTAVLGAILLTAHLGGAVASQVRVGNPLFSHILFPTYVAALVWGGLYLRDARVRALLPFRR
jgi:hypothetical protein